MNGLAPRHVTDADRARMLAEAEEARAANAEHVRSVEARRIGAAVLIDVGVEVYSTERIWHDDGIDRTAVGGVVVAITNGERDEDTGFITRRFAVLDPYKPAHQWEAVLEEREVNHETVQAAQSARLVRLIRRLAHEVAAPKSNILTPTHARYIDHIHALRAVVMPR